MKLKEPRGLTALKPDVLINAYCQGFFPMADLVTARVAWYSPDPRAIIPLDSFHVSRSLRRTVRKRPFEIRINSAFESVIKRCSEREETWISSEIIKAYTLLHTEGFAHSVECWNEEGLRGGLYGVAIGGAFFGESMFSLSPDASKVALVHLVQRLKSRKFLLLDTQFINALVARFGAREISRSLYLRLLQRAVVVKTRFEDGECGNDRDL